MLPRTLVDSCYLISRNGSKAQTMLHRSTCFYYTTVLTDWSHTFILRRPPRGMYSRSSEMSRCTAIIREQCQANVVGRPPGRITMNTFAKDSSGCAVKRQIRRPAGFHVASAFVHLSVKTRCLGERGRRGRERHVCQALRLIFVEGSLSSMLKATLDSGNYVCHSFNTSSVFRKLVMARSKSTTITQ